MNVNRSLEAGLILVKQLSDLEEWKLTIKGTLSDYSDVLTEQDEFFNTIDQLVTRVELGLNIATEEMVALTESIGAEDSVA